MRLFGVTPKIIRGSLHNRGGNMDQGPHIMVFFALYGGCALLALSWLKRYFYHAWGWERGSMPTRQQVADRTLYSGPDPDGKPSDHGY